LEHQSVDLYLGSVGDIAAVCAPQSNGASAERTTAGVSAPIGLMDTVVLQNAELLAGAHLLNEAVGIIDNILTVSYEKTIIDGELISRVKSIIQDIDGPDCDLNIEMIKEVGHAGNYLLQDETFKRCRDRWRATHSYCGSYSDWEKQGGRDIVQRANKTCKEILAVAPETLRNQLSCVFMFSV
jgi:trimethylamine:corrinoid methyltransferase-like protein